jgi:hypothetical protein
MKRRACFKKKTSRLLVEYSIGLLWGEKQDLAYLHRNVSKKQHAFGFVFNKPHFQ